jgi:hypothetical protein
VSERYYRTCRCGNVFSLVFKLDKTTMCHDCMHGDAPEPDAAVVIREDFKPDPVAARETISETAALMAKHVMEHKPGPTIPMMGYEPDPSPVEALMSTDCRTVDRSAFKPDPRVVAAAHVLVRAALDRMRFREEDEADWRLP